MLSFPACDIDGGKIESNYKMNQIAPQKLPFHMTAEWVSATEVVSASVCNVETHHYRSSTAL